LYSAGNRPRQGKVVAIPGEPGNMTAEKKTCRTFEAGQNRKSHQNSRKDHLQLQKSESCELEIVEPQPVTHRRAGPVIQWRRPGAVTGWLWSPVIWRWTPNDARPQACDNRDLRWQGKGKQRVGW